jgi:tetratricopeptide (TPR) repeat protein
VISRTRIGRRAAIELGAGLTFLFLAVTLLFALANVRRWQHAVSRGDARFQAVPADTQSPSGLPPKLARWDVPHGYAAGVTERLLGLNDDLAFRRALASYRAANPNPNEQSQFNDDPELPAKRIRAQQALTAVSKNDPDPRIRSRATNMLGILARTGPTPVNPDQQRAQILSAIGLFRSAIRLDPNNADAKLNLELVLQDPQTELFVTGGAGANPDAGTQGGTSSAGQGY